MARCGHTHFQNAHSSLAGHTLTQKVELSGDCTYNKHTLRKVAAHVWLHASCLKYSVTVPGKLEVEEVLEYLENDASVSWAM